VAFDKTGLIKSVKINGIVQEMGMIEDPKIEATVIQTNQGPLQLSKLKPMLYSTTLEGEDEIFERYYLWSAAINQPWEVVGREHGPLTFPLAIRLLILELMMLEFERLKDARHFADADLDCMSAGDLESLMGLERERNYLFRYAGYQSYMLLEDNLSPQMSHIESRQGAWGVFYFPDGRYEEFHKDL
jgi:hypothetical protein